MEKSDYESLCSEIKEGMKNGMFDPHRVYFVKDRIKLVGWKKAKSRIRLIFRKLANCGACEAGSFIRSC